jgi:hypothetical protein
MQKASISTILKKLNNMRRFICCAAQESSEEERESLNSSSIVAGREVDPNGDDTQTVSINFVSDNSDEKRAGYKNKNKQPSQSYQTKNGNRRQQTPNDNSDSEYDEMTASSVTEVMTEDEGGEQSYNDSYANDFKSGSLRGGLGKSYNND